MPINHLVLFQLKATAPTKVVEQATSRMLALQGTCLNPKSQEPYIKSLIGGKDNSSSGLQNGIHSAIVVDFDNTEDEDFYVSTAEPHKAFIPRASSIIEQAIVVDYGF